VNRESMVSRNPRVVARELPPPDGAVLLHLDTGAYHGLNPVGFVIWGAIEEERSVADVVEAVRDAVIGAPPSLEAEVLRFLEGARDRDLVRVGQG
jgi:hypothetical protein